MHIFIRHKAKRVGLGFPSLRSLLPFLDYIIYSSSAYVVLMVLDENPLDFSRARPDHYLQPDPLPLVYTPY